MAVLFSENMSSTDTSTLPAFAQSSDRILTSRNV